MLQPEAPFGLPDVIFPWPEDDDPTEQQHMMIHLKPEQERRIRTLLSRGAYQSVNEVVEAALTGPLKRVEDGNSSKPKKSPIAAS